MTTKHTCGGPVFGRKAPPGQCPRCDELLAGAQPVQWSGSMRKAAEVERTRWIRLHNCRASGCGPICTAFDW